jgi:hypothetical protein
MDEEIDYDLSRGQWETLKMLRAPLPNPSALNRFAIDHLVGLGLVAMSDGLAVITRKGRKALVRGSFRLWDLAA